MIFLFVNLKESFVNPQGNTYSFFVNWLNHISHVMITVLLTYSLF